MDEVVGQHQVDVAVNVLSCRKSEEQVKKRAENSVQDVLCRLWEQVLTRHGELNWRGQFPPCTGRGGVQN